MIGRPEKYFGSGHNPSNCCEPISVSGLINPAPSRSQSHPHNPRNPAQPQSALWGAGAGGCGRCRWEAGPQSLDELCILEHWNMNGTEFGLGAWGGSRNLAPKQPKTVGQNLQLKPKP